MWLWKEKWISLATEKSAWGICSLGAMGREAQVSLEEEQMSGASQPTCLPVALTLSPRTP